MADFDYEARPTFEEMLAWRDQLNGEWSDLDDGMEDEEHVYFEEFDIESPGGRLAVRTGSAPADADAAIDTLIPPDISVRVRPARAREKYRKQADKLVRMAKGLLLAWRRKKDVLRLIAADMTIRRVAVWRIMVDYSLWPRKPEGLKGRGPFPTQKPDESDTDYEERVEAWEDADDIDVWEVRHRRKVPVIMQKRSPRHVRWKETDEGDLLVVVEHYLTSVVEAKATMQPVYGDVIDEALRGLEPTQQVWVDDIWRGRWRCLVLNDHPVFGGADDFSERRGVEEHDYGDMPYVIAPFRELTFDEMEKKYRGMFSNSSGLYPIEANVLTMHVWMLAINAWRTYLGWTKDGRPIEIKPGQYIPMDERIGEYLRMLEGQPVPEELLKTSAVIDQMIQRNSVAQGPRTAEGTRSAQQLWAVQSMRTLKIESAKDSLTRGLNRSLELAAMHIEKNLLLDEGDKLVLPVPGKDKEGDDLAEVVIKASDIDGYWEGFEVSLGRRLDPALLEQWKALQGLATNKWMPHRTSIELSGATDNPQEWIDELVREAVDALPFVLEQVGLDRIKNWFGEDSERFIALSQRVNAQGAQRPANTMQQPTNPMKGGQGGGGGGSDVGAMLARSVSPRGAGRPAGSPQRAGGRTNGRPVG